MGQHGWVLMVADFVVVVAFIVCGFYRAYSYGHAVGASYVAESFKQTLRNFIIVPKYQPPYVEEEDDEEGSPPMKDSTEKEA